MLAALARWPLTGMGAVVGASLGVADQVASAVRTVGDLAGEAATGTARSAKRAVSSGVSAAVEGSEPLQSAMRAPSPVWRRGRWLHVPLASTDGAASSVSSNAAEWFARQLAIRPDVVTAYWDGGLGRLVIGAVDEAAGDWVLRALSEEAGRHGLRVPETVESWPAHPGDPAEVRDTITALAVGAAGFAAAVTGRTAGWTPLPRWAIALNVSLREHPTVEATLRRTIGARPAQTIMTTAGAFAYGLGQDPATLLLDTALRAHQFAAALARMTAFHTAHDRLCASGWTSLPPRPRPARPAHTTDAETYRAQVTTGGLLTAAAVLLLRRSPSAAAEAVLASSPKAARYGPTAFVSGLDRHLAREGVLVRDPERLRVLELVDTLVLHPSALLGERLTVLDVEPITQGWTSERLWQAATAVLGPEQGPVPLPWSGPRARLSRLPGPAEARWVHVRVDGATVGRVLVGWELDPLADAVLDAARQSHLRVILVGQRSCPELAALVDEVVRPQSLASTVRQLQTEGRVVLTVARPGGKCATNGAAIDLMDGLLRSDVALAVYQGGDAVAWDADLLAIDGLQAAWRVLTALPPARRTASTAKGLAQAGTALAGLLLLTGSDGAQRWQRWTLRGAFSPVNLASASALVAGWLAAQRVATAAPPAPRQRVPWHALPAEEVLHRLSPPPLRHTSPKTRLAQRLRDRVTTLPLGEAMIGGAKLARAVQVELTDPLTPVLALGATASAILGSVTDALLVAGAMVVNAIVGATQRLRAEAALAGLVAGQQQKARRVAVSGAGATDLRSALREPVSTVEATELVVGDVIDLRVGDVVPADARLISVADLEVDESPLTGESLPVSKCTDPAPGTVVSNRSCMVFEDTSVVTGHARAVVVGTGEHTESGRASALAARTPPPAGIQSRLHELTQKALPLTLAGGAAVTVLSMLRGHPLRQALEGGIAVAVAAVPEGLPLVATVAQMAAARRLARHGVLVRAVRALEALGRVDTVCFDKTGTLTENSLRVVQVVTAAGHRHHHTNAGATPLLRTAARACPHTTGETAHAHATDDAILDAGPADPDWVQLDGQPFEASRGYAAATGTDATGSRFLVVKGAPEVVLAACRDGGSQAQDTAEVLAQEGLRLIAVAQRRLAEGESTKLEQNTPADLDLLGFVALADTPRESAAPLVAGLLKAGVNPVMLTGDHPHTALAIATSLGWPADATVVTGDELAETDGAGQASLLREASVVARVAPEQKLQVIEALRAAGRITAMIGDGANDAAAIRAADVGVGVAARGSVAARNAAHIVLTGKDLTVLVDALDEGKVLWRSVSDAVGILIGGNAGEVGFTLLGTLLAGNSPLSGRQLLLVNLLTDMFPAMAVAVTPADGDSTNDDSDEEPHRPGHRADPLRTTAMGTPLLRQIRDRGIVTGLGAATAWHLGRITLGSARRTSTMALCGLVSAQLAQTALGRHRSPVVLLTTLGSALALAAVVQTPGVSHFFGCTPMGPVAWSCVAASVVVAVVAAHTLPTGADALSRLVPTSR